MTPAAAVVHQPPTRTRLRIPSRRCAFLRLDRAAPGRKPGIHWARTNAATGSIVIEHAGEFGTIASDAARDGPFELQRPPSGAAGGGDDVQPSEAATFRTLSLSFMGLSAYRPAQGHTMASAVENFRNTHGSYGTLDKPWLTAPWSAAVSTNC